MGRRRRTYAQAEIDAMIDLVKGHSYEDAAKLMEIQFPPARYSASQVYTQVKLATGAVPPETAISTMPRLAGAMLPRSLISQYSRKVSGQSWPVDRGIEQVDNYSRPDLVDPVDNPNEVFQYVVPNSFNPAPVLAKDPSTMMVDAVNEVVNAIPRIGIDSMKNRMLNEVRRTFNPEPVSPQRALDYTNPVEDIPQTIPVEYKESEKLVEALKELEVQKEQEEQVRRQEYVDRLEALRKKVENFADKRTLTEPINPPEPIKHNASTGNLGKESQEKTSTPPENSPAHDSNGTGTVPPSRVDEAEKLKQPSEEEKHVTELAGNLTESQAPLIGEDTSTGQADSVATSHKPEPSSPQAFPIPQPSTLLKESQDSNRDQSNVQALVVKPEETSLPTQPSVNHTLRNQALTVLLMVGIGVAALYIFNPQVREYVFSQYVRIFSKAPPQSTSHGTFTQTQQTSYSSTQGYAQVNKPNDVAFF